MDTWYVGTKNMNSEYHQYLLKYKEEKKVQFSQVLLKRNKKSFHK